MGKKFTDIVVRSVSGLVLVALVVGALFWSKWSVGALFALIVLGGVVEFYRLCRVGGSAPLVSLGLTSALVLFAIAFVVFERYGAAVGDAAGRMVTGLLLYTLLVVPTIFVCELWHKHDTPIQNIAVTFAGIIYVALPMSMLLFIPQLLVGAWSPWAMLAYIAIIWANDVFAYLTGIAFGRHRMAERISPKKSWEGFVGGLIGAVAVGVAAGYGLGGNLYVWGGLALVVALTGVAGDFVESLFKRSVGVKDSGSIMPGHGGVLDRFDALFISVPYAFVYLLIIGNC
ncbi:MAG: phosphatidate cytidylyltransferase [Alistipes sp.]|nr:phosphatidate cytidylyltransferase [Alistipes sp.]